MTGAQHPAVRIRPMTADDWPAVRRVYEAGIATGNATLERSVPTWDVWDAGHRPDCRLVAVDEAGRVIGWAALSPYSSRAVYRGVAWESVYVALESQGHGAGTALLAAVVTASEAAGLWTLLAGVLVENRASLAVHDRAGFTRIGTQQRIGRDITDRWRDVVQLERRSEIVGVD